VSYLFNPVNKCIFFFVIKGAVSINGNIVPERDALGIWNTDKIDIDCHMASEFLIIETPVNQK
ncbi:MAG: pirin family protein, partial [Flavisolibacter sp.]